MQTINVSEKHTFLIPDGAELNKPATTLSTRITLFAFLNRFTDDEAVDIDLASIGNTRKAATVRRYMQKVNASPFIDLTRPELIEDLQKLVSFNILTQERVDTILSTPVQDHEIFKEN